MAAAGGGIERLGKGAAVNDNLSLGLLNGFVGKEGFPLGSPVDLALFGTANIEPLGFELPPGVEGVGSRCHRLSLKGLNLRILLRREFVGQDPPHVIFQREEVDQQKLAVSEAQGEEPPVGPLSRLEERVSLRDQGYLGDPAPLLPRSNLDSSLHWDTENLPGRIVPQKVHPFVDPHPARGSQFQGLCPLNKTDSDHRRLQCSSSGVLHSDGPGTTGKEEKACSGHPQEDKAKYHLDRFSEETFHRPSPHTRRKTL